MFNICCMCKYKVTYNCDYSYINEYGDFSDSNCNWVKILDACEIFKIIKNNIENCFCFSTKDNKIIFDDFDPSTGETSFATLVFEEVVEDNKKS